MLGKKSSERREKNVFFIHTNIVTKKWGENARNNFPETQELCDQKMLGKKSSERREENVFLFTRIS